DSTCSTSCAEAACAATVAPFSCPLRSVTEGRTQIPTASSSAAATGMSGLQGAEPAPVATFQTLDHQEAFCSCSIRSITLLLKSSEIGIASKASSAFHTAVCDSAKLRHAAHDSMCFSNSSASCGFSVRLQ